MFPKIDEIIMWSKIFSYIISKVKLETVVEDDQKAPFSITTTPRCSGGRYSEDLQLQNVLSFVLFLKYVPEIWSKLIFLNPENQAIHGFPLSMKQLMEQK